MRPALPPLAKSNQADSMERCGRLNWAASSRALLPDCLWVTLLIRFVMRFEQIMRHLSRMIGA